MEDVPGSRSRMALIRDRLRCPCHDLSLDPVTWAYGPTAAGATVHCFPDGSHIRTRWWYGEQRWISGPEEALAVLEALAVSQVMGS